MNAANTPNRDEAAEDGNITAAKASLRRNITVHWPLIVILLTLNFSVARDIITLEKRRDVLEKKNAQAAELLKRYGKQTKFVDGLKVDLQKIAPADAVAAKILTDFFPKPITPEPQKPDTGKEKKP